MDPEHIADVAVHAWLAASAVTQVVVWQAVVCGLNALLPRAAP